MVSIPERPRIKDGVKDYIVLGLKIVLVGILANLLLTPVWLVTQVFFNALPDNLLGVIFAIAIGGFFLVVEFGVIGYVYHWLLGFGEVNQDNSMFE